MKAARRPRARRATTGCIFETDFPDPAPGEGDVIVAVRASSLNYHDVFTRRGMPGIKVPMPAIMGLDVAGEIAEVGAGRHRLEDGRPRAGRSDQPRRGRPDGRDRAWRPGRALPGARAPADQDSRRRRASTDAAALPVAYGTALRMMDTNGHVESRREGADPRRLGRRRRVLRAARQARGRRGHRLRRHRRQGQAADASSAPTRRSTTSRRTS